ncbi:MAG: hypothetical protein ACTSWX_01270 [Promethearchaeota archaeon]
MVIRVVPDLNAIELLKKYGTDGYSIKKKAATEYYAVISKIQSNFPQGKHLSNEAIKILNECLSELEINIETICKKYGRLEFFLLLRRLPFSTYTSGWRQFGSAVNVHRLCILSIMKFCKKKDKFITWTKEGDSEISYLHYDYQMFVDLFTFFLLISEYNNCLNMRRIVWKDGTLLVKENLESIKDDYLKPLISLYDDRLRKNNANLYSGVGLGSMPEKEYAPDSFEFIPYCYVNTNHKGEATYFIHKKEYLIPEPNFILDTINIDTFIQILEMYKIDYEEKNDHTIEELITFILSLSRRILLILIENPGSSIYMITNRGMMYLLKDGLVVVLSKLFEITYEHLYKNKYQKDSSKIVEKMLEKFVYKYGDDSADLINFRPYTALYDFEHSIGVDISYYLSMFPEILRDIQLSPESKQLKGLTYEENLANIIKDYCELEYLFKSGKKLRLNGKDFAEIDLSYIIGDVGFLIECKGYSQTIELQLGERKAVEYRWQDINGWRRKLKEKVEIIIENPKGDNYKVPDKIKKIIPIICTSSVEFLFEIESYLDNNIPDVCTPFELIHYLSNFKPKEIFQKTVYYEIS